MSGLNRVEGTGFLLDRRAQSPGSCYIQTTCKTRSALAHRIRALTESVRLQDGPFLNLLRSPSSAESSLEPRPRPHRPTPPQKIPVRHASVCSEISDKCAVVAEPAGAVAARIAVRLGVRLDTCDGYSISPGTLQAAQDPAQSFCDQSISIARINADSDRLLAVSRTDSIARSLARSARTDLAATLHQLQFSLRRFLLRSFLYEQSPSCRPGSARPRLPVRTSTLSRRPSPTRTPSLAP